MLDVTRPIKFLARVAHPIKVHKIGIISSMYIQFQVKQMFPCDPFTLLTLSSLCRQDGTPTSKTFEHIPSEIGAEEAEEVGVEHLLR